MYHPNFPPNLSITPNVSPVTNHSGGDGGCAFGVEAQREAISKYGIAGRVWEAAYALCAYVDTDDSDELDFDPPFMDDNFEPLGVIELGSGTGMVASSVARTIRQINRPGSFVIATDLPDVCPLLHHNLGINILSEGNRSKPDAVFVRSLTWGNLDHATSIASEFGSRRLTHVLCSDLASTLVEFDLLGYPWLTICHTCSQVYFPELLGPLLRTLIHLTSPPCAPSSGPPVKIVLSYKVRSLPKETPFWSAFGLWFSFQPVLARRRIRPTKNERTPPDDEPDPLESWRQLGADEDTDRIFVFVAYRRPESMVWHVPEIDKESMEGIGARDTSFKKGDDTFETILFMSIGIGNIGG